MEQRGTQAKQEGKRTLAGAAANVGVAMLWLVMSMLVLKLLGGVLFGGVIKTPPEWLRGVFNVLQACIPFVLGVRVLWKRGKKEGLRLAFGRSKIALWVLLGLFLGSMVVINSVTTLLNTVLNKILLLKQVQPQLPASMAGKVLYFCVVCLVAPVFEELFFRGTVQSVLRPWGSYFAIVTTTLLFTLMHSGVRDILTVFLLSLLLGYVAEISGSMWACIVLHAANNTYVFLTMLAGNIKNGITALGLALWMILLLLAFFLAAVWFARKPNIKPLLVLPKEQPQHKKRKGKARHMMQVPLFTAGFLAAIASFVLRLFW